MESPRRPLVVPIGKCENDQEMGRNLTVDSPKRSPAVATKHFMVPTISAVSRASTAREKVLCERNGATENYVVRTPRPRSRSSSRDRVVVNENTDCLVNEISVKGRALMDISSTPRPKFHRHNAERRKEVVLSREKEVNDCKRDVDFSLLKSDYDPVRNCFPDIVRASHMLVGVDSTANFWLDNWLGYVIAERVGFPEHLYHMCTATVADCWKDGCWVFHRRFCEAFPDVIKDISHHRLAYSSSSLDSQEATKESAEVDASDGEVKEVNESDGGVEEVAGNNKEVKQGDENEKERKVERGYMDRKNHAKVNADEVDLDDSVTVLCEESNDGEVDLDDSTSVASCEEVDEISVKGHASMDFSSTPRPKFHRHNAERRKEMVLSREKEVNDCKRDVGFSLLESDYDPVRNCFPDIVRDSRVLVGVDSTANFWLDNWLGYVIAERVGFPEHLYHMCTATVADCWKDGCWIFHRRFCEAFPDVIKDISHHRLAYSSSSLDSQEATKESAEVDASDGEVKEVNESDGGVEEVDGNNMEVKQGDENENERKAERGYMDGKNHAEVNADEVDLDDSVTVVCEESNDGEVDLDDSTSVASCEESDDGEASKDVDESNWELEEVEAKEGWHLRGVLKFVLLLFVLAFSSSLILKTTSYPPSSLGLEGNPESKGDQITLAEKDQMSRIRLLNLEVTATSFTVALDRQDTEMEEMHREENEVLDAVKDENLSIGHMQMCEEVKHYVEQEESRKEISGLLEVWNRESLDLEQAAEAVTVEETSELQAVEFKEIELQASTYGLESADVVIEPIKEQLVDPEVVESLENPSDVNANPEIHRRVSTVEVLELPFKTNVVASHEMQLEVAADLMESENTNLDEFTEEEMVDAELGRIRTAIIGGISVLSLAVGSLFWALGVKSKRTARIGTSQVEEPSVENKQNFEHVVSTLATPVTPFDLIEKYSRTPSVNILSEFAVGEMSSRRKCSMKSRIFETKEVSSNSMTFVRDYSVPISMQLDISELSSTENRSMANVEESSEVESSKKQKFTTPARRTSRVRNEDEGSEVSMNTTETPTLRRSSRLRSRGITSP